MFYEILEMTMTCDSLHAVWLLTFLLVMHFIELFSFQEAIRYLLPSGLFDKGSRPQFKVPSYFTIFGIVKKTT